VRKWLSQNYHNVGFNLHTEVFKQTLFYESETTANRWNGNVSRIDWSGMTGAEKTRTYNYDNANRLTAANYTSTCEANWFNLNGILYDANGNITKLVRRNQMTASTYGEVDNLTYSYQTNSYRLPQAPDSIIPLT